MSYLITAIALILCFVGMAIGLIVAKKVLRKGCAENPDDCACRAEGKNPSECTKK